MINIDLNKTYLQIVECICSQDKVSKHQFKVICRQFAYHKERVRIELQLLLRLLFFHNFN